MLEIFSQITPSWILRATYYTGSIGPLFHDFRFRYEQDRSDSEHRKLHAAVYSGACYEMAKDVQRRDFPWTEDGVAAMRQWFQDCYDSFQAEQASAG